MVSLYTRQSIKLKILWDSTIQTHNAVQIVFSQQKMSEFRCFVGLQSDSESENIDKYSNIC